jgi:hypothetical protein
MREWVVNAMPWPLGSWERDSVPIIQEAIFIAVAMKSQKNATISLATSFVFLHVMS